MVKYVCFEDGTDLTKAVEAVRSGNQSGFVALHILASDEDIGERVREAPESAPISLAVPASELTDATTVDRVRAILERVQEVPSEERPQDSPPPQTVRVECPVDGCQNVFAGEPWEAEDGIGKLVTVVGRPPTSGEASIIAAAKELSPDKSLTRVSDSAKYVVANISLVALVAGGFGIFSDARGGFTDYPELFGAVVVATVFALGSAVWALFPRTQSLDPDNLTKVREAYDEALEHRSLWSKVATFALLVALVLGAIIFFLPRYAHPSATLSATWNGSGQRLMLQAAAKAGDLPDDGRAQLVVSGVNAAEKKTTLTRETTEPGDDDGSANLGVSLPASEEFTSFEVRSKLVWDRDGKDFKESRVDTLTVTAPPFEPPPQPATE